MLINSEIICTHSDILMWFYAPESEREDILQNELFSGDFYGWFQSKYLFRFLFNFLV